MSNRFGPTVKRSALACMVVVAGLVQTGSALAALQLRDINGIPTTSSADAEFAYDTVLNVTWYLTGNNITMRWDEANSWAAGLTVGTFSGWTLPTTDTTCNGDGDGYNCTRSQMGELWYIELGNSAGEAMSNTGPFKNLQQYYPYWSGTEYTPWPVFAWYFDTANGVQHIIDKGDGLCALAVRRFDVAPVPEPAVVAFLMLGLGAVVVMRRMRPVES